MRIADIEVARAVIAHEAVDCHCGREDPVSEQIKKLVSCTGGVFYGKPGEEWPQTANGQPLIPWLQIVCTEMKGLYGPFYGKRAICFFIAEDFSEASAVSTEDCSDFVVREYPLEERIVPLKRPASLKKHKFHRVRWEREKDYPSLSKYYELFEESVYSALCEEKPFKLDNRSGIKIGGWPTPVQRDQQYPGSIDLQIDMTQNFMYADSGIGHLSRSADGWYVQFESC